MMDQRFLFFFSINVQLIEQGERGQHVRSQCSDCSTGRGMEDGSCHYTTSHIPNLCLRGYNKLYEPTDQERRERRKRRDQAWP